MCRALHVFLILTCNATPITTDGHCRFAGDLCDFGLTCGTWGCHYPISAGGYCQGPSKSMHVMYTHLPYAPGWYCTVLVLHFSVMVIFSKLRHVELALSMC